MLVSEQTNTLTDVFQTSVQEFKAGLRGELICPGDAGYDEARRVFNVMIDRKPALIARCAGVSDVISAVNFARANGLLVAVRGGGHHVAGYAVCDGGLVIDLSPMKGMRIDPEARTVRAEPGLTWGELNHDLQAFGLGASGGYVSITGIAGLTLGGGFGWLERKHGLACDNLLSVDIVTADGRFLTASATQHQDLFWGVRGGGGNFGVVTSFEFQVHPVGMVLSGLLIHPLEKAKEVVRFFREYSPTFPEELHRSVLFFSVPPAPFLPSEAQGAPVVAIALCYVGDLKKGGELLRPLREFGPPLVDIVQPMPFSVAQTSADILWPAGLHNYWKSTFLTDLSDDAIDTMVDRFAGAPSPHTVVVVGETGGALSRVGEEETAFAHRRWPNYFLVTSAWESPAQSEENIRWTREFWEEMQPFAANAIYVNFESWEGEDRVKAAYSPQTYDRLVELKNKHDPTNLFRLNLNIKPAVRQLP
jgi:FAD/FMN-containing dehydrogenase